MKIPGAVIARTYQAAVEPPRQAGAAVLELAPRREAPVADVRAVPEIAEADVIYLHERSPRSGSASDGAQYAKRALAAYDAVLQLRHRDDLRAYRGIDLFA